MGFTDTKKDMEIVKCPRCGKENEINSTNFCAKCGLYLKDAFQYQQNPTIKPHCKPQKALFVLTIIIFILFVTTSIFTIFFYPATFLRIILAVIGISTTILISICVSKILKYSTERKKYQSMLNNSLNNTIINETQNAGSKTMIVVFHTITTIIMILITICVITFSSPKIQAINMVQQDIEEKISDITVLYNAELNACVIEYRSNRYYNTAYIQFWKNCIGYEDIYNFVVEYGSESDLLSYVDYYDPIAVFGAKIGNDGWETIIY